MTAIKLPIPARGIKIVNAPSKTGITVDGPRGGAVRLYGDETAVFCANLRGTWELVDRSSWQDDRKNASELLEWLGRRIMSGNIVQISYSHDCDGVRNHLVALGMRRGVIEETDEGSLEQALRSCRQAYDHRVRRTQET